MSAADHHQISIEVGTTEMLLNAMFRRPVLEYVEDMKDLTEEEINAQNSTGRTMLHQAVILGKVDWARELLGAGANEMVKDGDGKTALQLAKEMLSKHAGKKERKDLLDMMLDRPSVGSASHGSSGDVGASIGTRRLISKLEESLKSEFLNISTQLNAMKESHEDMKVELKAVKNSQEDMKDGLNLVKNSLEGVKGEVNLVNKSLEGVKGEVNLVKYSQEEMKGEVNTVKKSLEGVKGEFNSMKNSQEEMKGEVNTVKKSQEEMKGGLNLVKNSLEGVKGEVDKLKTQIQNVELNMSAVTLKIVSLHKESFKEACIEGMMRKTNTNERRMRKLYEKMYDEDSILSTILQFIRFNSSVEVHVDFGSKDIGRMKATFRDHDGRERSGGEFYEFADFAERIAYVGGRNRDEAIIPRLALVLSQLCVLLAFGNKGLPYSKDGEREREYKGILEEVERKKGELDSWIKNYALDYRTTPIGKEIHLHAMVPTIIGRYGSSEGRSILNNLLPSLLEYFEKHVMTALRGKETMKRIAAEMVTRL